MTTQKRPGLGFHMQPNLVDEIGTNEPMLGPLIFWKLPQRDFRVKIGFSAGTALWSLLESLCRIGVLGAYRKY